MKKEKGFTITEVLIALALISGIGLMIAQLTVQQSTNSNQATDSFEINEFVIRIGESLRNKEACYQTLGGPDTIAQKIPAPGAPTPITVIRNADVTSGQGQIIFNIATKDAELSPRVKVKSMELALFGNSIATAAFTSDVDALGQPTLYQLQLNITFEKLGTPSTKIVRSIPVIVKKNNTSPNKIYSCYTDENSWYQQMCGSLLNGVYTEQSSPSASRICSNLNIKGSISTDGNFCFNEVNPANPNTAGNVHRKDCINSWYAGWASNYGGPGCETKSGKCSNNNVVIGVSVISCGKNCVTSMNVCCPIRLQKN